MIQRCDPVVLNQIKALVAPILYSPETLQTRQRRLARLGYTIAETGEGVYLATLPHGVRLMELR
ncbi:MULTISPECIES: hypothetical protein [Lentibacter]|jgi:hypothetical protein|uniref:hypothetical protein n=1 Tax=Lentibacter TaxID=1434014 RepID=UPI002354A44C|nr:MULTISPECIES: hypothetical protein [Lentibacter]MDG1290668.1 hypothetical protein [Lentibacter sp.]